MSSDRKKTDRSQSAEQRRKESEEQLRLLQTITSELTAAEDLSSALEVVLESEDQSADFISKPLFATLRHTVDAHS